MDGEVVFLGNPLFVSGNRTKDFNFVVDKMRSRMEGWKAKLLSQAARTVLIKNIISSILIYTMSVFLLPLKITKTLHAMVRRFWWIGGMEGGRFLSLLTWSSIFLPKSSGGLGKHNTPWSHILLGKYCHSSNFWGGSLPHAASPVVRGIWKTHYFIKDNSLWIIGKKSEVDFWHYSWTCSDGVNFGPKDLNPRITSAMILGDLMLHERV
ncbi:uncharacterized protein LOC133032371 [Cannabis sativa]|uniref:uncharacterized protein LOC133032371 n=1 Tax=Cannabis sativa TaxID=3483 RepID=UPI0029CAA125|nr:uncharacterized protein LOC133032371 [Cannabis sativa]